jgi:hypothetical protein
MRKEKTRNLYPLFTGMLIQEVLSYSAASIQSQRQTLEFFAFFRFFCFLFTQNRINDHEDGVDEMREVLNFGFVAGVVVVVVVVVYRVAAVVVFLYFYFQRRIIITIKRHLNPQKS